MFDTGVEAEIQNWAAGLVDTGQPHDVQLGASTSLWVGAGMPNEMGINQCVTACTMIARCLSWFGRDAYVVPVCLQIFDLTNTQVAWAGLPEPCWTNAQWSGHCVLYLPDTRSLFDPTIGQIRPPGRQEPVLIDNLDPAVLNTGLGCDSYISHGDRAAYLTLDSQWHPNNNSQAQMRAEHNAREMELTLRPGFTANVEGYLAGLGAEY